MPRLPTPGGDDGIWGDILNDFLLTAHNADGTLRITTNKAIFKAAPEATDAFSVRDQEDTPIFNVDTQNRQVGIGVIPAAQFHVSNEANTQLRADTYSGGSATSAQLSLRKAAGTAATPVATPSGHRLGIIDFRGHDGTTFGVGAAAIAGYSAEIFSSTAQGTTLRFETTTIGSTTRTERMRIDDAGNVGIGITPTTKLHVAGNATFTGTVTASGFIGPYSTGFTQGSVAFADSGGTLAQDNANFFWDASGLKLGVGTATPTGNIQVIGTSVAGADITRYGSVFGTGIRYQTAGGTKASPAAIGSNYFLGTTEYMGYDGTTYRSGAKILAQTEGTLTSTDSSTALIFQTTPPGTVSVTEKMRITAAGQVKVNGFTAGTVAFVIKAAASQSANLTEWQNSSSAVLASVDSAGNLGLGVTPTAKLHIDGGTIGATGARVVGVVGTLDATSTTGAITGQDLTFTTAGGVGSTGRPIGLSVTMNSGYTGGQFTRGLNVTHSAAGTNAFNSGTTSGNMGIIVTTNGTGTDNIGTYSIAAGATGLNIGIHARSSGSGGATNVGVSARAESATTNNIGGYFGIGGMSQTNLNTSAGLIADNGASTSPIFLARDAGTTIFSIIDGGNVGIGTTGPANKLEVSGITRFTRSTDAAKYGTISIENGNVDYDAVGTINHVWKNAGSEKARLDTAGNFAIGTANIGTNNRLLVNPYSTVDNLATAQVNTNAATNKGLVVQGFASQSADLQQWQNSGGTPLASISSAGAASFSALTVGGTSYTTALAGKANLAGGNSFTGNQSMNANLDLTGSAVAGFGVAAFTGSSRFAVTPWRNDLSAIYVMGAASQTGPLQIFVNNSSVALMSIEADGSLKGSPSLNTGITVTPGSASGVVLTAKGFASQSADLQQWQNSSGTPLAKVGSDGSISTANLLDITAGGPYLALNSTNMTVNTRQAGNIGLVVHGFTSQSGDLQQWQNAGSTVLTRIDKDGNIGLGGNSFGGGTQTVFIANAGTVPTTNPTGGGIMYVEGGALKYRGSSGTITVIAPA